MTYTDQDAKARNVLVEVMRAALDGSDVEMQEILADADRETLIIMNGGLVILASTIAQTMPREDRAALREQLMSYTPRPGRMAAVRPEECRQLLVGLFLALHDSDEHGFTALLDGIPRASLITAIRNLAEVAVNAELVAEDEPGAARASLAREALNLAAR